MKEIELFYLRGCPYCAMAKRSLAALTEENDAYRGIAVRWIEETDEPALADARDYYHVPSVFFEGKKLFEAKPGQNEADIRRGLQSALDRALGADRA